jgi:hypothetical protein
MLNDHCDGRSVKIPVLEVLLADLANNCTHLKRLFDKLIYIFTRPVLYPYPSSWISSTMEYEIHAKMCVF